MTSLHGQELTSLLLCVTDTLCSTTTWHSCERNCTFHSSIALLSVMRAVIDCLHTVLLILALTFSMRFPGRVSYTRVRGARLS
jgi:hypothetical protein